MEATQVYRARLHGGTAPLTLANDLKRGGAWPRPRGRHRPAPASGT